MKKSLLVLFTTIFSLGCIFAQNATELPVFDVEVENAENAIVFDVKNISTGRQKNYGDYIRLINFTGKKNLTFSFYGYNKNGWTYFGDSEPNNFADSEIVETEFDHKYQKYPVMAIVPKDGKKYDVRYSKILINMYVVKHNCSVFKILPFTVELPKNAAIVENASVQGKFKDNIKIVTTTGREFDVSVLGSNDKETWEFVGGGTTDPDADDDETLELVDEEKTPTYKYYAVYANDNSSYNYEFSKAHNDLYITISE